MWEQPLGFWNIAEHRPEAAAVVASPDGAYSYGEIAAQAHQLVHTLRAHGLGPGAIVGILAPNGVLPVVAALACHEAGWYSTLVNGYLTGAEVAAIVEHAQADALIVHEQHADVLSGAQGARLAGLTAVFGVGDVPDAAPLDELRAAHPTTVPGERSAGGSIAYSSGTTGQPKGIVREAAGGDPGDDLQRASVFGRAFGFLPFEGPHLVSTAMYHGGCHAYCMGALNVGHGLVVMSRFDAAEALALIEHHGVRSAYMVATQFHRLLQLPADVRARHDVSSLTSVVHSAAPCSVSIKQQMMDWWGPVLWDTYGGMEGAATIAKPHRWLEKPGTVGRAIRGVQLAIFDDDGNALGPDETGHIYYRTVAGFSYHRDQGLTRQAHQGDMFTIGDIGYLDADGYLFIQDRAKDMIISGGVNIYPAEVEAVLLEHPAVDDVAVIGEPDDDWGERVLAVVQPSEAVPRLGLEAALAGHCEGRLAAFKHPRRYEFRDALPRTDAGKMYKRRLRDGRPGGSGAEA